MLLLKSEFNCYWKLFFVKLPRPGLDVIEDAALRFSSVIFTQLHEAENL